MDKIKNLLKEKGQRVTLQKKEVYAAVQHKPQTVREILALAQKNRRTIDIATVYRILDSFVKLGLVKEVYFGTKEVRYELAEGLHHHHLVCTTCGSIEDIAICEDVLLQEVKKQSSFNINDHSLEFFGTCKKCQ